MIFMARYVAKVSLEETVIDANNNNPVLESEFTNDDEKRADENYQLEMPDDILADKNPDIEDEGGIEKQKLEASVGDHRATGDNLVKSTEEIHIGLVALENIYFQLEKTIQTQAKLTPAMASIVNHAVNTIDRNVGMNKTGLPSLESYNDSLAYSSSQIALEGIADRIKESIVRFGENTARILKNMVGLANSMTPLINGQIARLEKVKGELNSAHRDAGQKEVHGGFVKQLAIDGKAPDAKTVIQTASYLDQCLAEILDKKSVDQAGQYIEQAAKAFESGINDTLTNKRDTHTNPLWGLVFRPELVHVYTVEKTLKYIKVDTSIAPEFFKLYPSVSKVNHSFDKGSVDRILDTKRSLPLFGNKVLAISQYKREVEVSGARHAIPKLTLINFGPKSEQDTIQALKPQEQSQVLDLALKMLIKARDFYKDYATRNQRCMDVFMKSYRLMADISKAHRGIGNFSKAQVIAAAHDIQSFYTRIYWNGLFDSQGKIADYARKTASNLITLVEHSSKGAQGSTPSTESLDTETGFESSFV